MSHTDERFDQRLWAYLRRKAQEEGREEIEQQLERQARERSEAEILRAIKRQGWWWPGDN